MMVGALAGLGYAPVVAWGAAGVALVVALRRSHEAAVLRIAAAFLAGWAVLVTTVLVYVVLRGGVAAMGRLVASPMVLFHPGALPFWLLGGVGALGVFAAAFAVNQGVGRGFLHLLRTEPLPWPERLLPPPSSARLLSFHSDRAEAFTFTLLEVGGPTLVRRREMILLSNGLRARLSPEEQEAVVAHELSHVQGLDGRYLTFFRTLAQMMRWDPVLAYLALSLTRHGEFRADLEAARLTGRPLALARALFKATTLEGPTAPRWAAAGFLGPGGVRGRQIALARIQRLVELAESGAFSEDRRE